MVNYREILRLHSLKYSQREIAASVHSSRSTIQQVLSLADHLAIIPGNYQFHPGVPALSEQSGQGY